MMAMVPIGDDELPAAPPVLPQSSREWPTGTPKGGPLARLAAQWCNDAAFQRWCTSRFTSNDAVNSSGDAADLIRYLCCIQSRAELDSNEHAKRLFDQYFRLPYSEHLKKAGAP